LIQLRRGEQDRRPWIGRRGITVACASILLVLLALVLSKAVRGDPDRLVAAAAAVCLPVTALFVSGVWRGRRIPLRHRRWRGPPARRRAAFAFGLCWAAAFYLSYYAVPALIGFPAITVEACVAGIAVMYLSSRPEGPEWSASHWVALIAGALTPAMLFDAFQVATLETVAVLAAALFLLRLFRRVEIRPAPAPAPAP
jgi:hypothetical protein